MSRNITFVTIILTLLGTLTLTECRRRHHVNRDSPKPNPSERPADYGDPAYLTPLIQAGEYEAALNLSRVGALEGTDKVSYSGFINVNQEYNSNLFFWFFPSENESAPVVVWLQGGPGATSLFGLFVENGPFVISENLTLSEREFAWSNAFSMLYIDNPVGAGFSFTDNEAGYARNQTDVARDLYAFLLQFFTLFSDQVDNDFYVTGESYAGKFVPAISYKIHTENPDATLKINLKGIATGDGLSDPETQIDYGSFLYQVGLIDEIALAQFEQIQNNVLELIRSEEWIAAVQAWGVLLNNVGTSTSLYHNVTGLNDVYNYLYTNSSRDQEYFRIYLELPRVRRAIHTGNLSFTTQEELVQIFLQEDILKSVKPWVEVLIENYKYLVYSGQVDVVVATPLTYAYVNSLVWSGAAEYSATPRSIWKVAASDSEVAGYARTTQDFTMVVVRDAGHMAPYDQPRAAYDMIKRFIYGSSWN